MKATAFGTLILIGLTTGIGASSASHAQTACPVEASRALDEAQKILQSDDQAQFGVALACVTQALAQTHAELEALREGRAAFSGQVHAPKGIVMTKPSVQEGR